MRQFGGLVLAIRKGGGGEICRSTMRDYVRYPGSVGLGFLTLAVARGLGGGGREGLRVRLIN